MTQVIAGGLLTSTRASHRQPLSQRSRSQQPLNNPGACMRPKPHAASTARGSGWPAGMLQRNAVHHPSLPSERVARTPDQDNWNGATLPVRSGTTSASIWRAYISSVVPEREQPPETHSLMSQIFTAHTVLLYPSSTKSYRPSPAHVSDTGSAGSLTCTPQFPSGPTIVARV